MIKYFSFQMLKGLFVKETPKNSGLESPAFNNAEDLHVLGIGAGEHPQAWIDFRKDYPLVSKEHPSERASRAIYY